MRLGDVVGIRRLCKASIELGDPHEPFRCLYVATQNHEVEHSVDYEHDAAQHPLQLARKRRGVEDREQVVLDEAGVVGGPTALRAKPVLERRERTKPAGELDPRAPSDCRDVQPGHPRPAHNEQTAKDNEHDEREMDDNGDVCEQAEDHDSVKVSKTPHGDLCSTVHVTTAIRHAPASSRCSSHACIPVTISVSSSAGPSTVVRKVATFEANGPSPEIVRSSMSMRRTVA